VESKEETKELATTVSTSFKELFGFDGIGKQRYLST
jgi:hypothetical protein